MKGEYRVKNEELRDLFLQAQELAKQFTGGVTITHVRRAQNSRADALCNEALDGKRLPMPRAADFKAAKPTTKLRAQALACLDSAAAAWRTGAVKPTVEQVW